jgi:hypothetical protein
MTHRDEHGNIWIMAEPDSKCELCGTVSETRPYGPNNEQICYDCGVKNEPITTQKMVEFAGSITGLVFIDPDIFE